MFVFLWNEIMNFSCLIEIEKKKTQKIVEKSKIEHTVVTKIIDIEKKIWIWQKKKLKNKKFVVIETKKIVVD